MIIAAERLACAETSIERSVEYVARSIVKLTLSRRTLGTAA